MALQGDECGIEELPDEPDEADEPDAPDEADYVMADVRGGGVGVSWEGRYLGTWEDREGAEDGIREHAGEDRPDVWFVSDHGNAHLVAFDWKE